MFCWFLLYLSASFFICFMQTKMYNNTHASNKNYFQTNTHKVQVVSIDRLKEYILQMVCTPFQTQMKSYHLNIDDLVYHNMFYLCFILESCFTLFIVLCSIVSQLTGVSYHYYGDTNKITNTLLTLCLTSSFILIASFFHSYSFFGKLHHAFRQFLSFE